MLVASYLYKSLASSSAEINTVLFKFRELDWTMSAEDRWDQEAELWTTGNVRVEVEGGRWSWDQ